VIYFSVMMNGPGSCSCRGIGRSTWYYLYPPFQPFEASTTELDSCCLIQEDTGPIRFGTMTNDYREVVAVLRTGVVFSCFELVYLELFLSGSNPGFLQTFIDIDGD
jgi:hypothetical protein